MQGGKMIACSLPLPVLYLMLYYDAAPPFTFVFENANFGPPANPSVACHNAI
jgi:hypothetical protein